MIPAVSQGTARRAPQPTVKTDGYEVKINVPRIEDERHPEGSEAVNLSILRRLTKAQTDGEPLPGTSGWLNAGGTAVQEGPLTAITLSYDSYGGGAHPNTALETVLYDADRGKEVELSDLFADKSGYLQELSDSVTSSLQAQPDVDQDFLATGISPNSYTFAAFEPGPDGLTFMLPASRIGPYGAGMFEAEVDWEHLRGGLDPMGPMWRESVPFAWDQAPDGQLSRATFERLLALRNPDYDRVDPKGSDCAREAADDFMLLSECVSDRADMATLCEQWARLHQALAGRGQESETRQTFIFIEQGLRDGTLPDREQATMRFLNQLLAGASAEDAKTAVLQAPQAPGTVERGTETVVINGITVPVRA